MKIKNRIIIKLQIETRKFIILYSGGYAVKGLTIL